MWTRRTIAVVAVLFAGSVGAEPPVPDYKIESIELSLFDTETGETRPLPADGFNLFGDLIVKVKISGPRGAFAKGRQLAIELSDKKQPAQKRDLSGIGAEGSTYALAYFTTGIICGPMTVRARLQGQKAPALKEVKLTAFDCGE